MSHPTNEDPVAALAGELGAKSRQLAEAIALLPKCVGQLDRQLMLARIERLRRERDKLARQYREAAKGVVHA